MRPEEMSREQERFLKDFFHRTLYPIVTPLAIDPVIRFLIWPIVRFVWWYLCGQPSPACPTGSFHCSYSKRSGAEVYRASGERRTTCIHAVGRFLRHYFPRLYHGFELLLTHAIRVTRDADFGISRRRDETLMMTIEQGVRERRMGDAVRLQYDPELAKEIVVNWWRNWNCHSEDLYPGKGFTAFTDFFNYTQPSTSPTQGPASSSALRPRLRSSAGHLERYSRRRCHGFSSLSVF